MKRIVALVLLSISLFTACSKDSQVVDTKVGDQKLDYWPTNGWKSTTPEEQGMDSKILSEGLDYIKESDMNMHSLTIIRNGYIVCDVYFPPYAEGEMHNLASVSKSITSILSGIAIDQGLIESEKQLINDFLKDMPEDKKHLTIEDLLTMRTGLEVSQYETMDLFEMLAQKDWQQYIMNKKMNTEETGQKFEYTSFAPYLVSSILTQATDMDIIEYSYKYLFEPLGINKYIIPVEARTNTYFGWGDVKIQPKDLAKIGLLYLNGGVWDGKSVISSDWIEKSTAKQVFVEDMKRPGTTGYGYYWWLDNLGFISARGRAGQRMEILPEKNLIVVVTSGNGESLHQIYSKINNLYSNYILPSIQSETPLPKSDENYKKLQDNIDRIQSFEHNETNLVKKIEVLSSDYINTSYKMSPNLFGCKKLNVTKTIEGDILISLMCENIAGEKGITGLNVLIDKDGESRYSTGRYDMAIKVSPVIIQENMVKVLINEIGNIDVWELTVNFDEKGVNAHFINKSNIGMQEVLKGMKE